MERELTLEGDPEDIVFVYRDCCKKRGCPCEQWSLTNKAAEFFETLKERRLDGKSDVFDDSDDGFVLSRLRRRPVK